MTIMPVPQAGPYPNWTELLKALWSHGMSRSGGDLAGITHRVNLAKENIIQAMTQQNEARTVRPSAFLACARQTYFIVRGDTPVAMPDNIGTTFAVGHLLHELSYAAVQSALPAGFSADVELPVDLPPWWPAANDLFNKSGRIDLVLNITDFEQAGRYLAEGCPERILVDFKTMGGYSYKKHGKSIWGEDPDAFGYLAQLAVYADTIGTIEDGAIMAGINRDSLTKPLFPRHIPGDILKAELERVQLAIEMALEGSDPGEEFLVRHGSEANFQCGRGGRPGFCPFKGTCADHPTRDESV